MRRKTIQALYLVAISLLLMISAGCSEEKPKTPSEATAITFLKDWNTATKKVNSSEINTKIPVIESSDSPIEQFKVRLSSFDELIGDIRKKDSSLSQVTIYSMPKSEEETLSTYRNWLTLLAIFSPQLNQDERIEFTEKLVEEAKKNPNGRAFLIIGNIEYAIRPHEKTGIRFRATIK